MIVLTASHWLLLVSIPTAVFAQAAVNEIALYGDGGCPSSLLIEDWSPTPDDSTTANNCVNTLPFDTFSVQFFQFAAGCSGTSYSSWPHMTMF